MHIYPLVGTASVPSQLFKKGVTCQPWTGGVNPTWLGYEYGAEVAASNFVEGTAGVDP